MCTNDLCGSVTHLDFVKVKEGSVHVYNFHAIPCYESNERFDFDAQR